MAGVPDILVVLSTSPPAKAPGLARLLVERRLAACVNIAGPVTSVYRWQGKLCEDPESLLVIKTARPLLDELTRVLVENHPYEVPEVVALPVLGGNESYLRWVEEAAGGTGGEE